MKAHFLIAAAAATAALGLAAPAMAADKPNTTKNCFRSGEWQSWRGADANTIYLRISAKEFYRLDLSSGSNMVTDSSNHLVSKVRGSTWICSPLDLDLKISDGHITEPLIVKAITKLTPEEADAIPKKARP